MIVLLGAAAGLLCGLLEAAWLGVSAAGYFYGPGEVLRLLLVLLALGGGAGVVAGAVEALVRRVLPRRPWVYTLLSAPAVVWICAQIFAGPQARVVAHHQVIAVAIGAAALAAVHFGQRVLPRVPVWLAAASAVGLYAVDQKVLPRLYPFFHQGLGLLVFAAAQLALVRSGKWPPRRSILPSALGLLVAGGLALVSLGQQRALRRLVLERAVLVGPLARLSPSPPRRVVAVGPSAATASPAPLLPPGPRLDDGDVFLITIDAFRADRLDDRTAPNLTRLAARGVRFDHAYAQVPHTSFSVATLLTGMHVYSLSALGLEAAGYQTLAEVLKRERYKTAAFYPPSVFYIDSHRLKALISSAYGFEYVKYEYLPAPGRTQQIIDFFEAEKPRRAFVWVHYLEPHHPYEPHPGHDFGATAAERYDGEIHFVDAEVQKLVDWVQHNRPHALVVVASDHGEELGDHGGHYHGTTLYEEQVRVPLFFTALDGSLPARRIAGPVGLVDVAPTLLPLLGIAPSAKMRGRDLGPWLAAAGAPERFLGPEFGEIDRQKAIVDGTDKLVCDLGSDSCQLFDLAADPQEQHNLVDRDPVTVERLRARLEAWMREQTRFEHGEDLDPQTRRALERGRLGEGAAVPELALLLDSPRAAVRSEAARLIARLPPSPATRLHGDEPWIRVARARLGEKVALPECGVPSELCCYEALVTKDPEALASSLDFVNGDRELELQLISALGQSRDPRALDPLIVHLGAVRTRVETVRALEALGDVRAVPFLARWIAGDPYIPVRAAMATALGHLGARDSQSRKLASRALVELLTVENEAEVVGAARAALTSLR